MVVAREKRLCSDTADVERPLRSTPRGLGARSRRADEKLTGYHVRDARECSVIRREPGDEGEWRRPHSGVLFSYIRYRIRGMASAGERTGTGLLAVRGSNDCERQKWDGVRGY